MRTRPRSSPRPAARRVAGLLALTLAAAACTGSDDDQADDVTDLRGEDVALTSGLETLADCDALLDRLIDEGLERVGPYGFGQGGFPIAFGAGERTNNAIGLEGDLATAERSGASDAGGAGEGGGDFTGTNVQEPGVDEPDLVKTDGRRMVVAAGGKLQVLDVSGTIPALQSSIALPDDHWAGELFLVDDRAYLTTSGWTEVAFSSRGDTMPRWGGTPTTRIIEVDLVSGTIGRSLEFEGIQVSAREIDGTIRFVVSATADGLPFVYPSGPGAEDRAKKANEDVIVNSTIDQWLPSYRLMQGDDPIEQGRMVDCDRFHLPGEFSGFGTVAVLTLDAQAGLDPIDTLAVLTDGQTVYASTDRLTVATQRWPEWNPDGTVTTDSAFRAALHSFDISDPARTSYTGSGSVRGHLLSQYSLSEYQGNLRVATTDGDPWGTGDQTSESFVTVFAEQDGQLVQIGQVGGLGRTERIFAVRFLGPQAFVVTFRQTDPLYTVDLSDPANPRVVGELKIPGYSAYLHPVGDGTLIGVGQDAGEDGATTGSQMSLFDVKDPANPTRVAQLMLGEGAYSPVDGDPRAFTWLAEERLALVPISWWGWDEATQTDESGNVAVVVRVGTDATLTETGRIDHPVIEQCEEGIVRPLDDEVPVEEGDGSTEVGSPTAVTPDDETYCWSFQPEIRRTVVVGPTLFTISDAGVKANALEGLTEIAWIAFT